MGYYTYFKLHTDGESPDPDKLANDFLSITGYSIDALEGDTIKWYDYDTNMLDLSKLYPSTIFHLWGDGEDSDDNWHAVYCNGEYRKVEAEITYPKIDISTIGGIGDRHPEFFI